MMQPGPNTWPQYDACGSIRDSQAKPPAASSVPVISSGRTPSLGSRRELAWAPTMIVMAIGTKARPARSAL